MSWLIYALICAIFTSAAALVQKKTLIKQHAMEFSASLALINFILSIPLFFFIDFSNVTLQALGLIFVVSFFGCQQLLFLIFQLCLLDHSQFFPYVLIVYYVLPQQL